MKYSSAEFSSSDWIGHCRTSHFFASEKSLGLFFKSFRLLSICDVKLHPVSATGSHTSTPQDQVVCFRSWDVPSLLHTLLCPSLCYTLMFLTSLQMMLFSQLYRCFLMFLANSCLWSLYFVINPLYGEIFFWLLTLTQMCCPPGGSCEGTESRRLARAEREDARFRVHTATSFNCSCVPLTWCGVRSCDSLLLIYLYI